MCDIKLLSDKEFEEFNAHVNDEITRRKTLRILKDSLESREVLRQKLLTDLKSANVAVHNIKENIRRIS